MYHLDEDQQGFSLVELSIVLVILGLLTGGILGGQALMHAAELRSISQEVNKYQIATNIFKDNYFAYPGDMPDATQYWGRADNGTFVGQCAAPTTDQGTGTQTCNGDGDGLAASTGGGGNEPAEAHRFWQHLANAGLIEGQYTGIQGGGGAWDADAGINAPASKFKNGLWTMWTWNAYAGGVEWFAGNGMSIYLVGQGYGDALPMDILTPKEAWNIDTKIDDGRPGQGKVMTAKDDTTYNCITTDVATTAEYELAVTSSECILGFKIE